ncbi:MAG: hypothetical protein K0R55_249 [Sporomusa sp.]|nr:hypothetical protein [Sporomusa sp.]
MLFEGVEQMGMYPEHLKEWIFEDMTGIDSTECDSGLYERGRYG